MPRNSACRQVEFGSARISSRLPTDLPRAPVTRPWKWWTMSGHWADRPIAPRCSTKSPQIPHGSRLLFSIWAQQLYGIAGVLLVDAEGHGIISAKIASTVHDTFHAFMLSDLDRYGATTPAFFEHIN